MKLGRSRRPKRAVEQRFSGTRMSEVRSYKINKMIHFAIHVSQKYMLFKKIQPLFIVALNEILTNKVDETHTL